MVSDATVTTTRTRTRSKRIEKVVQCLCNGVIVEYVFFLFIYLVFRSTHTWLLCLLGWLYVSSSLIIYVLFYAC
jgi:hypothetical protein